METVSRAIGEPNQMTNRETVSELNNHVIIGRLDMKMDLAKIVQTILEHRIRIKTAPRMCALQTIFFKLMEHVSRVKKVLNLIMRRENVS